MVTPCRSAAVVPPRRPLDSIRFPCGNAVHCNGVGRPPQPHAASTTIVAQSLHDKGGFCSDVRRLLETNCTGRDSIPFDRLQYYCHRIGGGQSLPRHICAPLANGRIVVFRWPCRLRSERKGSAREKMRTTLPLTNRGPKWREHRSSTSTSPGHRRPASHGRAFSPCLPDTRFPRRASGTASPPGQQTPDSKSWMRVFHTSGSVGAQGEESPGAARAHLYPGGPAPPTSRLPSSPFPRERSVPRARPT